MYNVDYVRATGVDHVVWKKDDPDKLNRFLDAGYEIENTTSLGEQLRISKVREKADGTSKILNLGENLPKFMQPGWGRGWTIEGARYLKTEAQDSNFGMPVRTTAGQTYEVDVAADPAGDALTVWLGGHQCGVFHDAGRATCSVVSDGFSDLWINSSGSGHPTISSIVIRRVSDFDADPKVFADGLVEVQGKNGAGSAQSHTDWARRISIDADLPEGGRAYINVWPSRHLRYYLNGKRVDVEFKDVRRPSIPLPPGASKIEVKLWSPFATYLFYGLIGWATISAFIALRYWRPVLRKLSDVRREHLPQET
jgi:hypothetical protein